MPTKLERLERITELQRAITAERYERFIGRTVPAIVDRVGGTGAPGEPLEARLLWQADDIDGITYLDGDAPPGSIVECHVTDVIDDYNFAARLVRVTHPVHAPRTRTRALPVVGGITGGSYGR